MTTAMEPPLDASAIAAAVAARRISAVAVAEAALARIDAYDAVQPQAWIARCPAEAVLHAAAQVDAAIAAGAHLPLAGVPFAIKDNIDLAGLPTTAACPDFAYEPAVSAAVVERLVAAGAIPVGKTNLDQFATGLNGTRSPYGAPGCVFNRSYISGGSSAGSAVVVAAGLVPFALGTDTAGSGRVPAGINGLIGMKPTKGRWSTRGLVPACRSLDCITVLARSIGDARLVDEVAAGLDRQDPWSRPLSDLPADDARAIRRVGVPRRDQRIWHGDGASERLYDAALARIAALGAALVEIDMTPLREAAQLLYDGPWVAERTAAVGAFMADHPYSIDPAVRSILEAGRSVSGTQVIAGIYRLAELQRDAQALWRQVDMLALPTAPVIYRIAEMRAAPLVLNSNLGLYTNFVNLLDMAALALPAGFRANRTGFGITLVGPAWTDRALLAAGERFVGDDAQQTPPLDLEGYMDTVKLAVVGAHLEGMPLHWQLTSRDARLIAATHTAASYRLYAMADSVPAKPALVFAEDGQAIAVEVYELEVAAFGSFVAEVPPPLAIGTVILADGSQVKGFVAEPRALIGAADVTEFGGWRSYLGSLI